MPEHFSKWSSAPIISAGYTRPIYVCLAQQLGLGLLCGLMLDFGYSAYLCGVAVALTWVLNGVIILRRPNAPTTLDLKLVRWSFVPFFFFTVIVNLLLRK